MKRAKTYPTQEKEQELKAKGPVFGLKCGELFAHFDPDSSSLKTSQLCLIEEGMSSLVALPKAGMMRNGRLYRQRSLGRRTSGSGCSLWPTPEATNTKAVHLRTAGRPPRTYVPESEAATSQGQLNAEFVEFLMGVPVGWTDLEADPERTVAPNYWAEEPPGVPRVTKCQKERVNRLRALGNGIVPQITEYLGRRIIEAMGA